MAEQKQDSNLFSIVGGDGDNKHIFFHGPITEGSTFNFITNILGIKLEIDSLRKDAQIGFAQNPTEENQAILSSVNDGMKIILHISCPGGIISQAFIMADTIKSLNVPVYCIAEGMLASAGLIPFLACEKRTMQEHSALYIHDTIHTFDQVEYANIDKYKADAKEINEKLKNYYCEKTNLARKEINSFFKNEKVFNYQEAKENNFINASLHEILS